MDCLSGSSPCVTLVMQVAMEEPEGILLESVQPIASISLVLWGCCIMPQLIGRPQRTNWCMAEQLGAI